MKRAKSFVCLRVCFIVPKKSEMCQHRLIAPDCFHPCKCLAIIRIVFFYLHLTQFLTTVPLFLGC